MRRCELMKGASVLGLSERRRILLLVRLSHPRPVVEQPYWHQHGGRAVRFTVRVWQHKLGHVHAATGTTATTGARPTGTTKP